MLGIAIANKGGLYLEVEAWGGTNLLEYGRSNVNSRTAFNFKVKKAKK